MSVVLILRKSQTVSWLMSSEITVAEATLLLIKGARSCN